MLWSVFFRRLFRGALFSFFCWMIVFTNYGLLDYLNLRKRQMALEKEYAALIVQRDNLMKYVRALSGPEIDLDLLEIQVRKILVYAMPNEEIYFWH